MVEKMYCRDCDKVVVPKVCDECSCYDEYATYCTKEHPSSMCSRGSLECPNCKNSDLEILKDLELFNEGRVEGAIAKQKEVIELLKKKIYRLEMYGAGVCWRTRLSTYNQLLKELESKGVN